MHRRGVSNRPESIVGMAESVWGDVREERHAIDHQLKLGEIGCVYQRLLKLHLKPSRNS